MFTFGNGGHAEALADRANTEVEGPAAPAPMPVQNPAKGPPRPNFDGVGLLITGGVVGAAGFGAGIGLTALNRRTGGSDNEKTMQTILASSMVGGVALGMGATIGGTVLRGHYDGWRVQEHGSPAHDRTTFFAVGGTLMGLGAAGGVAGLSSALLYNGDFAPLVLSFSAASLITGAGLVAYMNAYKNRLRRYAVAPTVTDSFAGLTWGGRF